MAHGDVTDAYLTKRELLKTLSTKQSVAGICASGDTQVRIERMGQSIFMRFYRPENLVRRVAPAPQKWTLGARLLCTDEAGCILIAPEDLAGSLQHLKIIANQPVQLAGITCFPR